MGLEYKPSTIGGNLSTLAVPTAPKQTNTQEAAVRAYTPASWQETLIPTLVKAGAMAYNVYKQSEAESASQEISKDYLNYLTEDSKREIAGQAKFKPGDDSDTLKHNLDVAGARSANTPEAKLASWGEYHKQALTKLDNYSLKTSDRDKLKTALGKTYETKVLQLRKDVLADRKSKSYKALTEDMNSVAVSQVTSQTMDIAKFFNNPLQGAVFTEYGDTQVEHNKAANESIRTTVSFIQDSTSKLKTLKDAMYTYISETKEGPDGELVPKYNLTDEDAKTYSFINTAYNKSAASDSKVTTDKAKESKRSALDTLKVLEKGPFDQNTISGADGPVANVAVFNSIGIDTTKDSYMDNAVAPGFIEAYKAAHPYASSDLIAIAEKEYLEANYYKGISENLKDTEGIVTANVATIVDPKLKTLVSDKVKTTVLQAYEEGDAIGLLSTYKVNPEIVESSLKPKVTKELGLIFSIEDVGQRAEAIGNFRSKLDTLGYLGDNLVTPETKVMLDALEENPNSIEVINGIRSGKLKYEDYRIPHNSITEATKGLSFDETNELKKLIPTYGLLYGSSMTSEEVVVKALKDYKNATRIDNSWYEPGKTRDISMSYKLGKDYPDKQTFTDVFDEYTPKAWGDRPYRISQIGTEYRITTVDSKGHKVHGASIDKSVFMDKYLKLQKKKSDERVTHLNYRFKKADNTADHIDEFGVGISRRGGHGSSR